MNLSKEIQYPKDTKSGDYFNKTQVHMDPLEHKGGLDLEW